MLDRIVIEPFIIWELISSELQVPKIDNICKTRAISLIHLQPGIDVPLITW